ncbi:MAG: exosortase/archaeosortase family protein [Janthinobacterium lividum]
MILVFKNWHILVPFVLAGLLLGALAWPVLHFWEYEYTKPESYYGHAPLIPLIAGLMVWHRRSALAAIIKEPTVFALLVLIPALALLVFAIKIQAEALESTGLLLTVTAGVWLVLGTAFVRAAAFPLAFLWLMAPLPGPVLNDATLRVQMLSTVFANDLLHLMTFSTTLTGNVIQMEDYALFVDVPCSGFKLLLALLTFSAAFAYLVDGTPGRRLALFAFSLPLSLLVNSVRIALIGVVGECIGTPAALVFHDWSGLITLTLGFVALFGLAKGLGCRTFAGWAIF